MSFSLTLLHPSQLASLSGFHSPMVLQVPLPLCTVIPPLLTDSSPTPGASSHLDNGVSLMFQERSRWTATDSASSAHHAPLTWTPVSSSAHPATSAHSTMSLRTVPTARNLAPTTASTRVLLQAAAVVWDPLPVSRLPSHRPMRERKQRDLRSLAWSW